MGQNGKGNVKGLHSFAVGAKYKRHFNDETMMFACNSSGSFSAGHNTEDAHFQHGAIGLTVDCMHSAVIAL